MRFFPWLGKRKTMQERIRENIDSFNEENNMGTITLPDVDVPAPTHIGEDVDVVLLVQRLVPVQIARIDKELRLLHARLVLLQTKKAELERLLDKRDKPE